MSVSTNDVDLLIKTIHTPLCGNFWKICCWFSFCDYPDNQKQYIIYLGIAWH